MSVVPLHEHDAREHHCSSDKLRGAEQLSPKSVRAATMLVTGWMFASIAVLSAPMRAMATK